MQSFNSVPAGGEDAMQDMFRSELEQQCATLTENLLILEKGGPNPEALQNLMRAAHSLKGAARIMRRRGVEQVAHAMEDCFVLTQHGALMLERSDIDALLEGADYLAHSGAQGQSHKEDIGTLRLAALLSSLEKISLRGYTHRRNPSESRPVQAAAPSKTQAHGLKGYAPPPHPTTGDQARAVALVPPKERSLKVTAESLNRLLGLAGESLVESRWLQPFTEWLRRVGKQQAELARAAQIIESQAFGSTPGPEARAALEDLRTRIAETDAALRSGIEKLQGHDRRVAHVSHRLYLEVLRTRVRPFSDISRAFPRLVRDLAIALGKEVRLDILGENTQVDREALGALELAITHMLRNAVDHGCETPQDRLRAGKPAECRVTIHARHRAGMLVVSISDDGAGIDSAKLREAAAKLGGSIKTAGASDADLLQILFLPGFTMRHTVSEVSGRGVGLDVVHSTARTLRGSVKAENNFGRGMRFTLQLPLTASVLRTLVVVICDELYAIPLAQIERVAQLRSTELVRIQGHPHFRLGKDHVPLACGREIMGYVSGTSIPEDAKTVVLGQNGLRAGLTVDSLVGERELIVQRLDPRLGNIGEITAAALMDDGAPVLIVEPEEVIRTIQAL